MPVNRKSDRIVNQRFFEPARADEGVDLRWFALDSLLNRRVVHQRDTLRRAQPGESRFELEPFVDGFVHELLDRRFAPRPELTLAEATGEPLDAGDSHLQHFVGIPVENREAGVGENRADLVLLA